MNVHKQALRAIALKMMAGVKNEDALARSFSMEVATNATLRGHLVRFALPLILADDEIDGEEANDDLPGTAELLAPSPSKPIGEKDRKNDATPLAKGRLSSSPTPSGGEDHTSFVALSDQTSGVLPPEPQRDGKAMHPTPRREALGSAPPRPAPTAPSAGFVDAMARSKMRSAAKVLFTLHDGRNIMTVEMRELPAYRKAGAQQAVICDRILKHASNADPYWKVNRVITDETLEKFVREFEREVRHVA
jgi:hypothetical protein